MSRKSRRHPLTRAREASAMTGQGGNFVLIPASMLQTMFQQHSPQKNAQGKSLLPGAPMEPHPDLIPTTGPRQWDYPIGWNISSSPGRQLGRQEEIPTFQQLRTLARAYDGIQMCERVWLDLVGKLSLTIKPRPELIEDGEDEDSRHYQKDIARYLTFFEKPDSQHDLHEWLRTALVDQLELDALTIYMRPTRSGGLHSMEILDASTIKPLLDDRGRSPDPPFPAYQQFLLGGVPSALLTTRQLLYVRESPRSDSPYGISRIEKIVMKVNQALRKQQKDLARFTDGNIPAGFLKLPESEVEWTADDISSYQRMFDALLAGNAKMTSRLKVMPPGSDYLPTDEPDIQLEFDRFLLNTTVAAFGLSMADLGFTEDVNRSSGDSQENMTYRRTMQPLMSTYARLFTQVLREYFDEHRFVVSFAGYEEPEDLDRQSTAYSRLVGSGILSPSDAARLMHLPVQCEVPVFIMGQSGPIFLEDLVDPVVRAAQKQAQLAGWLQLQSKDTNETPPGQEKKQTREEAGTPPALDAAPKKDHQDTPSDEPDKKANQKRSEDYRRWRQRALDDVKAGRPLRPFLSTLIPPDTHSHLQQALEECQTPDEVRAVFSAEAMKEKEEEKRVRTLSTITEEGVWQSADVAERLEAYREQGVRRFTWHNRLGACDTCIQNDKKTIRLGEKFPTGVQLPPVHPNCECSVEIHSDEDGK